MLNINFDSFPVLTTDRLVLRQLIPEDAAALFILRTDKEVNKFIDRPKTESIDDASRFIQKINEYITNGKSMYWAISLKNEPNLVGTICYWNVDEERQSVEIGFELGPGYQGMGIMQEAIQKVIRFGFEKIQAKMITAVTHLENKKSIRLLKKNNFDRDEKLEKEISLQPENNHLYVLKKTAQ